MSIDILNDDVLYNIMTFHKPTNIIFLNEVNKRFYSITKKNFPILFPRKKQIINDMKILVWAYNHGWKNRINLKMLLTNDCSVASLNYFHKKYNFSKRKKYYYSLATNTEQLNWLKQNRFDYSELYFDSTNKSNIKWMKENLIIHQNQLLDYIMSNPNDYEEVEFACENIYDLRIFVHNAATRANNLPMLKWSVEKFKTEFNKVKEHEDLFILNAENGNLEMAKFLLQHNVPYTGLTIKIAKEEKHFDFITLLMK
jgi:hypothetical protein